MAVPETFKTRCIVDRVWKEGTSDAIEELEKDLFWHV